MQSRADRIYNAFPDLIEGYELNPEKGYFSVIIPEETTNMVLNPSAETNTTGYAATGGATITRISSWQAYGAYGMQIAPVALTESGINNYPVNLAAATTYTFSAVIQGEPGRIYYAWFADAGGALIGSKRKWIGTGHKQRIWVTHTETAGALRRAVITRDASYNDTNLFYADGFQVEAKAYPTTYCDGDQIGLLTNEIPYYWTGVPHASASFRTSQTRAGGKEVNLLDLGFKILAVIGLGLSGLVDQSLSIPGLGEFPQGSGTTAKTFSLVGSIEASGPRHLQAIRSDLINVFKPDLTAKSQPLILRYQPYDQDDIYGDSLDITATYQGGLEGSWNNHHGERIALNFKMYVPIIHSTYFNASGLGLSTTITGTNYVIKRDVNGIWSKLSTGLNGAVRTVAIGQNGYLYVGGDFSLAGGVAGTDHIAAWNGSAWEPLSSGCNGNVNKIVVAADGSLYVGGAFTLAGAIADTAYIAKWDGVNWTAMDGGTDEEVKDIAIGPDGTVYIAGYFTVAGATPDTIGVASYNGSTWVSVLATGISGGFALCLAVNSEGDLYVGGSFTHFDGIDANYIAYFDGAGWFALPVEVDDTVNDLYFDATDKLYAAGEFGTIAGVAHSGRIAVWNGVAWSALGDGIASSNYGTYIWQDRNDLLYFAGYITAVAGRAFPDGLGIWNGSNWSPLNVDLPGTILIDGVIVTGITEDNAGNLYIGFTTAGNSTAPDNSSLTIGDALSHPVIKFYGPGYLYQLKNYTTGREINFNIKLQTGEVATLNLDPLHISFSSQMRGNLISTILPGSDFGFDLLPGLNHVSVLMYGSTSAASAAVIYWQSNYWSIDAAAWK